MLSVALFGVAFAACGLPATIDPDGECVTDANGFSTLDADSDDGIPISLTISEKGETTDAFKVVHPGTVGALTDDTATDGRYILACKQLAGVKTVRMTVTRPEELTAFGGEWMQLFPKDSWANTTNEYEPFTFNHYGAKIPLPEFRATPTGLEEGGEGAGLSLDAATADVVNVFMEVKDEGDYEVMYGNPGLKSGDKWVAVQFKSTLLRVGTPWAECSEAALGASTYEVGSIMPILFGGPNLHSVALKAGFPSYFDVISELQGVTVPVKVVLEVFSAQKTTYTDSAVDGQCYKAGNACPEAHAVCKAEYCEMDVWKQLISDFKAAGSVTVLGSVDSQATLALHHGLDLDGFYFTEDVESIDFPLKVNFQCENAGTPAGYIADVGKVYADRGDGLSFGWSCDLSESSPIVDGWNNEGCRSRGISADLILDSPFCLDRHGLCEDQTLWRIDIPNGEYEVELDFGDPAHPSTYGGCKLQGTNLGVSSSSTSLSTVSRVVDVSEGFLTFGGYSMFEENGHTDASFSSTSDHCGSINAIRITPTGTSVRALGSPLFDADKVDNADVYVTLAASELGVWSPFSWYPYVPPAKWAAIVTGAADVSAVETLFDRGYGWVYLTSEAGFETKSTIMTDLIGEIEATATRRKLQARRLEASEGFWGCDDTLFECRPICMRKMGVVTTKVSDSLCSAAPMDQCACKCFHEAQWGCEGDAVVCKARYGADELKTVGDKVCETRGAPKPTSTAELRVASSCAPVTEMRGSSPTAQCLSQWGTPAPSDAPTATEAEAEAEAEETDARLQLLDESFATAFAYAALALYA
jgi:hypothetical protein